MVVQEMLQLTGLDSPSASSNGSTASNETRSYHRYWELSPHLLAIFGIDGRVRRVNSALKQLLGLSEDALRRSCFLDHVHPEDRDQVLEVGRRLAGGTDQRCDLELRLRSAGGDHRSLVGSACVSPDDELVYLAASDVTERRRAEREVSLSQELAL